MDEGDFNENLFYRYYMMMVMSRQYYLSPEVSSNEVFIILQRERKYHHQ